MNDTTTLVRAVANNLAWCDAVCRGAGGDCRLDATLWINAVVSPRAYPNAITRLDSPQARREQLGRVGELATRLGAARGWGVKDSFAQLDLGPHGFERLFDAEWIHRPARSPHAGEGGTLTWRRVDTADALSAWEAAWSGQGTPPTGRVFADTLLGRPDIAFVAGHDGDRLCCGLVATRAAMVVGISNLFATPAAPPDWREQACLAAQATAPGHDLVGYDSGDELGHFHGLGFRSIGPLRVWLRGTVTAETSS